MEMNPQNLQTVGRRGLITIFVCILVLLVWSPLIAQARPEPDESLGAYIELHVVSAPAGAWAVVQWQDSVGNWHNVDGWQNALATGKNIRWWVAPKDFGRGPFRWAVTESPGECLLAVSSPFTLPDEANEMLQITLSLPGFVPTDQPTAATMEKQSPQMDVFQELWNVVNTNYLYEDFNGVCWEALKPIVEAQINKGMTNEVFWATMSNLIEMLNDGHSFFLAPAEAEEESTIAKGIPHYVGIGVRYRILVPEGLLITHVYGNSPAESAGIKSHDWIVAADDVPACCDEAGKLNDLNDILRGPEGSDVTVTIRTPGESPHNIVVTRAPIRRNFQFENRRLKGDIGYILIPTLNGENIAESTLTAWRDLNAHGALNGLILDLRVNKGGWRGEREEILTLFVDGMLGEYRSRHGSQNLRVVGRNVAGSQEVPLVVLVSEFTASAAEILAGILQETGRATVVGSPTTGNLETRYAYDLPDGSRVWIAVDTFVPLSGANWEITGIKPNIEVMQGWGEFATDEDDLALIAALKSLNGN